MKSISIYEPLLEQNDNRLPYRRKTPVDALEQIRLKEAMRRNVVTLAANLTVGEAVETVQNYEFTTFPVLNENNRCIGVVAEMRPRRNFAETGGEKNILKITDKCHALYPEHLLNRAVVRMNQARVRQLSVVLRGEARKFLGITSR